MHTLRVPALLLLVAATAVLPALAGKGKKARLEILDADVRFARTIEERDLEGFRELLSEDALFFGSGQVHGRDAVARAWSPFFEPDPTASVSWTPVRAEASSSGDLGYTVGSYVLTARDAEGNATLKHGTYVTVWRKERGGVWRAILDIGTPPGAEPPDIPVD